MAGTRCIELENWRSYPPDLTRTRPRIGAERIAGEEAPRVHSAAGRLRGGMTERDEPIIPPLGEQCYNIDRASIAVRVGRLAIARGSRLRSGAVVGK